MVRSAQSPLTHSPDSLRDDLQAIIRSAIDGASAGRAVSRTLSDSGALGSLGRSLYVVAAGKAAGTMAAAAVAAKQRFTLRTVFAVGTHRPSNLPASVEWQEAAHPLPDHRSVAAGRRAIEIATSVPDDDGLVLLLSGGASALLAAPADGITLDDKRRTIEQMMHAGADIHALNTVRKHVSAIKGGRLAAACRGTVTTLAVSDVVGDDLSVIGSGPGVADSSTWQDASRALQAFGAGGVPPAVAALIAAGVCGALADTPKPGTSAIERASGQVIASRRDALAGARREAEGRGYVVLVLDEAVTGEARGAAERWYASVTNAVASTQHRVCFISAGETTVRVTGRGRGGRNQEFALALVDALSQSARDAAVASVGTDGIDGPTDAAGAMVDVTTAARAREIGLASPRRYLDENDSYRFFDGLGDLIRTGRTDTNVGDLQVYVAGPHTP